jgi:hypothetical protein
VVLEGDIKGVAVHMYKFIIIMREEIPVCEKLLQSITT